MGNVIQLVWKTMVKVKINMSIHINARKSSPCECALVLLQLYSVRVLAA